MTAASRPAGPHRHGAMAARRAAAATPSVHLHPGHSPGLFTAACLKPFFANTPTCARSSSVDNGSTDETPRLLEQYEGRVRVTATRKTRASPGPATGRGGRDRAFVLSSTTTPRSGPAGCRRFWPWPAGPGRGRGHKLLFRTAPSSMPAWSSWSATGSPPCCPGTPLSARAGHGLPNKAPAMQAVTAACMLVTRRFSATPALRYGLLERCEDVDLCIKLAQLGKRIVYEPAGRGAPRRQKRPQRTAAITANNARLRVAGRAGRAGPDRPGGPAHARRGAGRLIATGTTWPRSPPTARPCRPGGAATGQIPARQAGRGPGGAHRRADLLTPPGTPRVGDTSFGREQAAAFTRLGHDGPRALQGGVARKRTGHRHSHPGRRPPLPQARGQKRPVDHQPSGTGHHPGT
jgi:hypothetical protein